MVAFEKINEQLGAHLDEAKRASTEKIDELNKEVLQYKNDTLRLSQEFSALLEQKNKLLQEIERVKTKST